MRQVYLRRVTHKFASGEATYLYSDAIEPGYVLLALNVAATHDNATSGDPIEIGIYDGATHYIAEGGVISATTTAISTKNPIVVGAGKKVYAKMANVADTEVMTMYIIGELWDLKDWEYEYQPEFEEIQG